MGLALYPAYTGGVEAGVWDHFSNSCNGPLLSRLSANPGDRLKYLRFIFWNSSQKRLRTSWRLLLQLLLLSFFLVAIQLLISLASFQHSGNETSPPLSQPLAGSTWLGLLSYLGMAASVFLSVWLSGRLFDRRPFIGFGFALNRRWWVDFGFGLFLGVGLISIIFLVEYGLGWIWITGFFISTTPQLPFAASLLFPLAIFILVGAYEELLSRGYQLTNLAEGFGFRLADPSLAVALATLISSCFFGLLHAFNPHATPLSTINICLAGFLLATGYILTGQLAIPIGLHISWNFFQGNVFGFPVSGGDFRSAVVLQIHQRGPVLWTGGAFGPEGGLLGSLVPLLGMFLIYLWVNRNQPPAGLQPPISQPPDRVNKLQPAAPKTQSPASPIGVLLPDGIFHVIWDWNGTLLNDLDLCLSVINAMLRTRDLPELSRQKYLDVFGFPVQGYYQKIGFDFNQEPFETISTEFITGYESGRPGCQLMDGAREAIEAIHKTGVSQSILSASKAAYLKKALNDYGIDHYFCAVNGLNNHHAAGKLALAKTFLEEFQVDPRVSLLVGDTLHDAEIAAALGANCILIPNGHQSRQRLGGAGVPILDSLAELDGYLLLRN